MSTPSRPHLLTLYLALLLALSAGILARGYWTPDEPREADIAWRMSWQPDKAVPLLAGEPFCEKPPFAYWLAGASMSVFGKAAWAARLPNLLYAIISTVGVGLLARRAAGPLCGSAAAVAMGTLLLPYQVEIWLATDAALLAAVCIALLGAYQGFFAEGSAARLRGYTLMHAALGVGFLCKSAAAWMVPVLVLGTLVIWERRWRELVRWELYVGVALQAAVILTWVGFVYTGPDGVAHLKVFFWNNLAGRFTHVDAPQDLQYASAHRNRPGKYLLELPTYLWPWPVLIAAAARRAWRNRHAPAHTLRPVRFAIACVLPTVALLSLSATARNIYVAPAMPGFALLLGWWVAAAVREHDAWDLRAVRVTAALILLATLVFCAALTFAGIDAVHQGAPVGASAIAALGGGLGLLAAAVLAIRAETAARRGRMQGGPYLAALAYCVLLALPAAALYRSVDAWQNLPALGRAIGAETRGEPLILMAPDETTRAFIDMYASTSADVVKGPIDERSIAGLRALLAAQPAARVVAQLPGRALTPTARRLADLLRLRLDEAPAAAPTWIAAAGLEVVHVYALPNGRHYALLQRG